MAKEKRIVPAPTPRPRPSGYPKPKPTEEKGFTTPPRRPIKPKK